MDTLIGLTLVVALALFCFLAFFLPTVIGFARGHRNRWIIFLVNAFFGATVIGWFASLIWAMNKVDDPVKGGIKLGPHPNDPLL